ncbi:hypothetical protein GPECTOR_41g734 [Gonium pectorale]|uniref:LysM domain-containing protein n=1 Tax=Gonium pectorale TaxID=33097 RepID=A0A150GAA4_GONPE|nr:hypothetical protein GPECTOR_41g734 [Gonium pectorale]|eukprot:KXZ46769.1 hypothetical protein GPECTOR_41g734 [Gonium pectorale]
MPRSATQPAAPVLLLAVSAALLLVVAESAASPPPACAKYVTAKAGDTCTSVWLIANKKWSKADFAALNPGVACPKLKKGARICIAVALPAPAVFVSAGFTHTCAVLEDPATRTRGLKCFGDNRYGQLGLGDTVGRGDQPGELGDMLKVVDLGPGYNISNVEAGVYFTCALLSGPGGRIVKCWGNLNGNWDLGGSLYGQMGAALKPVPLGAGLEPSAIGVGDLQACAVLQPGGLVKCWGSNPAGQLGQGDTRPRWPSVPTDMGINLRPVWLGQVGSGLLPGPQVPLAATAVTGGAHHTCALLQPGGIVKCWGANNFGQLGQGDTWNRGDRPDQMGNSLEPVALGTGLSAVAVSAGWYHTCALLQPGGLVKCWGVNSGGELGQGDTENRGDQPGEMGDALKPVDLGPGLTAVALSAGSGYSCALLQPGGVVKCWGDWHNGRLGLGEQVNHGDGPRQMGAGLKPVELGRGLNVSALSGGLNHACVVLQPGGLVKCWGYNNWGQLGQGDLVDRGDDAGEMGDALKPVGLGRLIAAAT